MSLLTLILGSLSYADIDSSRATNLAPEEKYDMMAQAEASKKTPDKAYLLVYSSYNELKLDEENTWSH
jgi:hypothetical protein